MRNKDIEPFFPICIELFLGFYLVFFSMKGAYNKPFFKSEIKKEEL